MTVRVGIQPLAVRPEMAISTDGPGISLGFKADPVTINPFWFKALHAKDTTNGDVDVYGLLGTAKLSTLTLGAYGIFYNMRSYPFNTSLGYLDEPHFYRQRTTPAPRQICTGSAAMRTGSWGRLT